MRKADIINKIAQKTGVPKVDVLVSVEGFMTEIKNALINGEHVYIRGFGSFILKKRAAKIGRDIKKNTAVHIPEHYAPFFKASKEFASKIKKMNVVRDFDKRDPK